MLMALSATKVAGSWVWRQRLEHHNQQLGKSQGARGVTVEGIDGEVGRVPPAR